MKSAPQTRPSAAGFTLIEILLAITILSIVAVALYSTYNQSMRAYKIGIETGQLMQKGRFVIDIVARDLKNVYCLPETMYSIEYHRRLAALKTQINLQTAGGKQVRARDIEDVVDEFNRAGQGVDLRFIGKRDRISFVRYQSEIGARRPEPLNMARIAYQVDKKGRLVRSIQDVYLPDYGYDGEPLSKPAPDPEILAGGVKSFSLEYGYYYDGQWVEATDWDSSAKNHRVDKVELNESDPYQKMLEATIDNWLDNQFPDFLPAYVLARLELQDPNHPKKTRVFERSVSISQSMETQVPLQNEMTVESEGKKYRIDRSEIVRAPEGHLRSQRLGLQGVDETRRRSGYR